MPGTTVFGVTVFYSMPIVPDGLPLNLVFLGGMTDIPILGWRGRIKLKMREGAYTCM
ncbi:hypothetical protein DESC_370181 [Desulfosarcina cetonica]|nr:hypothetical protein DESC_370181 [Desulfosarcina cetonica]